MLSSVLRSKRAAEVNVAIMRTFVRLGHLRADETVYDEENRLTSKDLPKVKCWPCPEARRKVATPVGADGSTARSR